MALVAGQCVTWNDLAAEVAAGRMVWNGAAQSGTQLVTWAAFKAHVQYDGTNPAGLADTQCPNYNALIARASTIHPPTGLTGNVGVLRLTAINWTAPASGLAPTSYDVQYYQNGAPFGAVQNRAGPPAGTQAGYVSGDDATFQVRSVNGALASDWVESPHYLIP